MPTVTNATVVSQAYETSGNGGRKIASNSTDIFTVVKDTPRKLVIVQKCDRTTGTFDTLYTGTALATSLTDVSIAATDKYVYLLIAANGTSVVYYAIDVNTGVLSFSGYLDNANQTAVGNVSLSINEAKTELHATWASKNSTYPNSFNIRYVKGTINSDCTVTWGTVEQVTMLNTSGYDITNPSISIANGIPIVSAQSVGVFNTGSGIFTNVSVRAIVSLIKNGSTLSGLATGWYMNNVYYNNSAYTQASPSTIFVPQSINGLTNGRIWVSWHGFDSTDTTAWNIRVSYSDDLGVTWSTMEKLTTGNGYSQMYPSITANKNNEIFILLYGATITNTASDYSVKQIKNTDGVWGSIVEKTAKQSESPSTLFDFSFNFSEPLFVYKDVTNSKVGFYGSWIVSTISPAQSDIGKLLNRQNLLTYAITSDGTIGTVTEKVNGVTVGTKALMSGQNTTISVTQAQWDAIPFGQYRNNVANKNTIEISTSTDTFTYTFTKWLDGTIDIINATKANKDASEAFFPSIKKLFVDALNNQGSSVSTSDSWVTLVNNINVMNNKKYKTGTFVTGSSSIFTNYDGSTSSYFSVDIDTSVIGFMPSCILAYRSDKGSTIMSCAQKENYYVSGSSYANCMLSNSYARVDFTKTIIKVPVTYGTTNYTWIAYG